jgi:hypothetical protein
MLKYSQAEADSSKKPNTENKRFVEFERILHGFFESTGIDI